MCCNYDVAAMKRQVPGRLIACRDNECLRRTPVQPASAAAPTAKRTFAPWLQTLHTVLEFSGAGKTRRPIALLRASYHAHAESAAAAADVALPSTLQGCSPTPELPPVTINVFPCKSGIEDVPHIKEPMPDLYLNCTAADARDQLGGNVHVSHAL